MIVKASRLKGRARKPDTQVTKNALHMRAWREANPERVQAQYARDKVRRDANRVHHRERRAFSGTGWLPGSYEKAFEAQGGLCALCGEEMIRGGVSKRSAVRDHHEPDGVKTPRALLHQECNQKLGYLESPERQRQAASYFARYGSAALGIGRAT